MEIQNEFVKKYFADNNLTLIDADQERPWGAYYIFEQGKDYDKKVMWIKANHYLSLQYHGSPNHPGHSEHLKALNKMRMVLGTKDLVSFMKFGEEVFVREALEDLKNLEVIELEPGEEADTPAGFLHAYVNPFETDFYLIETRTSQIEESYDDREANIVRIYDQTGRNGVPKWPDELIAKIKA